jgi:tetratricopeptide (TPR) repeat protein
VAALVVLAGYLIAGRLLARLVAQARRRRRAGWVLAGMAVLGLAAALGCLTARRNEDYRSARAMWEDIAHERPANPRGHLGLGAYLLTSGDARRAIDEFDRAVELDPRYAEAWHDRALAWQGLGRFDRAVRDDTRAIDLRPTYAAAYNGRGAAYRSLRQFEPALRDCTKAVELAPRHPDAYNNRGNIYYDLGQYDRAVRDLTRAIDLRPDFSKAYVTRAACYRALGAYDKAWADVKACEALGCEVDPDLLKQLEAAAPRPP